MSNAAKSTLKWVAGIVGALIVAWLTQISSASASHGESIAALQADNNTTKSLMTEVRNDVKTILQRLK